MKFFLVFGIFLSFVSLKAVATEYSLFQDIPYPKQPFLMPQTNFYTGFMKKQLHFFKSNQLKKTADLTNSKNSLYGFELEVNANSFWNIGTFFNQETLEGIDQGAYVFSVCLGGFSRFFYFLPFLSNTQYNTNLFIRIGLGLGPALGLPAGGLLVAHGNLSGGIEVYVSRWIGLSFAYEIQNQYGITLQSGINKEFSSMKSFGHAWIVSLKTTWF